VDPEKHNDRQVLGSKPATKDEWDDTQKHDNPTDPESRQ
jgi:hypothetical protein